MLIVAPAFPPHPSPATHRARFLASYGPRFGWDVEVLTVRPSDHVEPPDEALASLVPARVRITRVPALPAPWTRRLGVGDLGLRSYLSLRRALVRRCRTNPPDLLYFPGPPFYPFRLGPAMRRRFGVRYALDYTDPWVHPLAAGDQSPTRKIFWAHRLARWLEPAAARGAALLVAVSDATHDGIRARHPEIEASRYLAEPFGSDVRDFESVRGSGVNGAVWAREEGAIHVVYVGAVAASMLETVRALLAGLAELRARRPDLGGRLRLHFVGTSYDPFAREGRVAPLARTAGLSDVVTEEPRRLPYLDALRALTAADCLLALGSVDRHYTASKIFNCILARRPMLTVFHEDSPVVSFVRESGAGELVTYSDVERAESRVPQIADALERLAAGRVAPPGPSARTLLENHTAQRMTERVLAACDAALGGAGPARAESSGVAPSPIRATTGEWAGR